MEWLNTDYVLPVQPKNYITYMDEGGEGVHYFNGKDFVEHGEVIKVDWWLSRSLQPPLKKRPSKYDVEFEFIRHDTKLVMSSKRFHAVQGWLYRFNNNVVYSEDELDYFLQ